MTLVFPKANQKYESLALEARRLVRNPRYNRLFARLPSLSRVFSDPDITLAEIYWEAYNYVAVNDDSETGLLDSGLRGEPACFLGVRDRNRAPVRNVEFRRKQVRLARDILGAIAFEMFFPTPSEVDVADGDPSQSDIEDSTYSKPSHDLFRVSGFENVDRLYDNVFTRLSQAEVYWLQHRNDPEKPIWTNDRESLRSMNARGLEHFILDGDNDLLHFMDITVQAFFAAYWATNYHSKIDLDRILQTVPDPVRKRNEVYREFWTFAAEMPIKHVNDKHWYAMFAPLYDHRESKHLQRKTGDPIRSTELIYRTWERMKNQPARIAFQSQFKAILNGDHGIEKQDVARALLKTGDEDNFLRLCEGRKPRDDGCFKMGGHLFEDEKPIHEVQLSHYRLHRYCVQNREFELFEPCHKETRKIYFSAHPVVGISWFDAICFARWLGDITTSDKRMYQVTVPTEAQWEYACRAGQTTPYTWGVSYTWDVGRDQNSINRTYCNYENNIGTTVQVDGTDELRVVIRPNPWGFYQMHGNVWEWCWDWYDKQYYGVSPEKDPLGPERGTGRVARGGGESSYGASCRSGARSKWEPSSRWYCGFRLAAVPIEPSKH